MPCHLDLMSLIYIGDSCRLMSTDVAIGRLLSTNVESRPTNVESRPTNVESRPTNVDRVRQKSRHVDKVAFCLFVSAQRKSGHLDLYGLSRYLYVILKIRPMSYFEKIARRFRQFARKFLTSKNIEVFHGDPYNQKSFRWSKNDPLFC